MPDPDAKLPLLQPLLAAAAGTAALGAAVSSAAGPLAAIAGGISLAGVTFGVALLMVPTLYVGSSLIGQRPSMATIFSGAIDALGRAGGVALGLSPALLFLVATTIDPGTAAALAHLAVAGCITLGLVAFHRATFEDHERPLGLGLGLYLVWSLIGLGIGWRLWLPTL